MYLKKNHLRRSTMTESYKLRRNDDPITSHIAADAMDANKMERIVLDAINSFKDKGCISDDVLDALPTYRYSSITARYKALEEKGLIIKDDSKEIAKSGRPQLKMWGSKYYPFNKGEAL